MKKTVEKPVNLELIQIASIIFMVIFGLLFGGYLVLTNYYNTGYPSWLWLLLTVFGIILSIFLSSAKQIVWYIANIFWVLFLVFYAYSAITFASVGLWYDSSYIIYIPPLAYSVGCIIYFQTRGIKEYFGILKYKIL